MFTAASDIRVRHNIRNRNNHFIYIYRYILYAVAGTKTAPMLASAAARVPYKIRSCTKMCARFAWIYESKFISFIVVVDVVMLVTAMVTIYYNNQHHNRELYCDEICFLFFFISFSFCDAQKPL